MMPSLPRCLPVLLAFLLADAACLSLARAESPMPDPIAPAVIGRPLERIRPVRPAKPVGKKAVAPKQAPRSVIPSAQAATPPAMLQATPMLPARQAALADDDAPRPQRQAKRALDDREDPRVLTENVGQGTHFARKPLPPGVYFDDKIRVAVRKYYESHPVGGSALQWQIGEPLPAGAPVAAVPQPVLASLPKLPPGHRYLQVAGDILLVAARSGMVVDGISARVPR